MGDIEDHMVGKLQGARRIAGLIKGWVVPSGGRSGWNQQ